MKRIALALALLPGAAWAQTPAAQTYNVQLTDQQIEAILQQGAQCEARVPYACADYIVYLRNLLNEARKPKAPANGP